MLVFEHPVAPRNLKDALLVSFHCLTFVFAWPLHMYATANLSGNAFTIAFSSLALLMLVAQYTVLSNVYPGHRNWMEIVGAVLVFLGSSLSSFLEVMGRKKA